MANEITLSLSITLINGDLHGRFGRDIGQKQYNQTTKRKMDQVLTIGTSEETITFTDLTQESLVGFHNLDATNYIQIGPDATGMQAFIRLTAGLFCFVWLDSGATVKAQANTANCDMRVFALDA